MNWVELHSMHGLPVWVNMDNVDEMRELLHGEGFQLTGTTLAYSNSTTQLDVQESPKHIIAKLKNAVASV